MSLILNISVERESSKLPRIAVGLRSCIQMATHLFTHTLIHTHTQTLFHIHTHTYSYTHTHTHTLLHTFTHSFKNVKSRNSFKLHWKRTEIIMDCILLCSDLQKIRFLKHPLSNFIFLISKLHC
jgi:hypothetical protein